jgi:hypothetical protein
VDRAGLPILGESRPSILSAPSKDKQASDVLDELLGSNDAEAAATFPM